MSQTPVPLSQFLDDYFKDTAPSKVAATTAAALVTAYFVRDHVLSAPVLTSTADRVMAFARRTIFARKIRSEIKNNLKQVNFPASADLPVITEIPQEGMPEAEVVRLSQLHHDVLDKKFTEAHLSGAVYHAQRTVEFAPMYVKVFEHHIWSNLLFADFFGACRKIESEVIQMGVRLFNGDPVNTDNCGAFTSGGSESILMAMLAYRNRGRAERGITSPVVVCCETAHPAFDKAAEYYGIRLVKVPMNPKTFRFDASEAEKYLTEDTVAIVGSAPSYPHGVVDPIEDLAALAKRRGIGMHVDSCVGGMFIQFLDESVRPKIDFRIEGVTTISCDIHKWGGTPKGASLVLYREKSLRQYQMFACSSFPGGLYASMGPNGSKAGYTAALAWAALLHFGKRGYYEMAEKVRLAAMKFRDAVKQIEGLEVMGDPQLSIVAIKSDYFDIYLLGEHMKAKGWIFTNLQFPPGIHLGLTLDHAAPGAMDAIISELKIGVNRLLPPLEQRKKGVSVRYDATLYGSSQTIPSRKAVEQILMAYVAKTVQVGNEKQEE